MNTNLQIAIGMIRSGDTSSAYKILRNCIRENPKEAHAWYLLTFTLENIDRKIYCLERTLQLAPNHIQANKRLQQLSLQNSKNNITSTQILANEDVTGIQDKEIIENIYNSLKKSLDTTVEEWCIDLSFREKKVIDYLYLDTKQFSIGAVGRIISESPERVKDIHFKALEHLYHSYANSLHGSLLKELVEVVASEESLNDLDIVATLTNKDWSSEKYNFAGAVKLIRVIKDRFTSSPKSVAKLVKFIEANVIQEDETSFPQKIDKKTQESIGSPQPENTAFSKPKSNLPVLIKKPSVELAYIASKQKAIPYQHTHRLWQIDEGFGGVQTRPDTLQFLIDDIARLPILTNPNQELWLGVQLQAVKRLTIILTEMESQTDTTAYTQFLCQTLLSTWTLLKKECLLEDFPPPLLEVWISELLMARQDVYALKRSRMRRFLRRIQTMAEKSTIERRLELVHKIVETLAILPRDALTQFVIFSKTNQRQPSSDEMATWLPVELDVLKQQAEILVQQTQKTLTTGYLRYVLRIAQGYTGQGVTYADLVQAGFIGLSHAAKRFDYRVQARFGSYATSWIWQAVGREIADQGRTIRLPVHVQENLRKWEAACQQFDDGSQNIITNPDILFHAGLLEQNDYDQLKKMSQLNMLPSTGVTAHYEQSVAKARKLRDASLQVFSFTKIYIPQDNSRNWEETESVVELIPDENLLPHNIVEMPIIREVLEKQVLSLLTERESEILKWRYGWADGEDRTLEEVGTLYGLTRERIRQIEAKAIGKVKQHIALGLLPDLYELIPSDQPSATWNLNLRFQDAISREGEVREIADRLNALIAQLPRSHWHERQPGTQEGLRRDQLLAALQVLAAPSHVSDITEQLNGAIGDKDFEDVHIYTLLMRDETTFVLLGQGIFSLVEWEQTKTKESQHILTCCPMTLPDPPDYQDAFFESVLVGQQALTRGLTTEEFVNYMLKWSKTEPEQQKWFLQAILSAYYTVDLIPYVFFYGGENPVIPCTLPSGSILDLRYHCLSSLTERLQVMPEFWWLLQQQQPARPVDLGELFADIHPDGLNDVLQRLRLLTSLGATQKLKYGTYRLTSLGEECANLWKKEPVVETDIKEYADDTNFEDSFANFAAW